MAELLRQKGLPTGDPSLHAPEGNVLPLSDPQRRVLKEAREAGQGAAYHSSVFLRIRGADHYVQALLRGLDALVQRHEVWRTAFIEHEGLPAQRIIEDVQLPLRRRDLADQALLTQVLEDERQAFDLGAAPLVRACWYRMSAADHALLITAHHIVCDGWTVRLAMAELLASSMESTPPTRARPLVQYREYLARQRRWLLSPAAEAQKSYWSRRLSGRRAVNTPHRDDTAGAAHITHPLPPDVVARTAASAALRGVTAFSVHLAALYVALVEFTQERDITIGTPMHNRLSARDELVFGCCVNLQPIRIVTTAGEADAAILAHVWKACREAVENQSLCVFGHILGDAGGPNVVFELISQSLEDALPRSNMPISLMAIPRREARHDLHVFVDIAPSHSRPCAISILFRKAVHDSAGVSLLAAAYEEALRRLSGAPPSDDGARLTRPQ